MLILNERYLSANSAGTIRPRFTIAIHFDEDGDILYLTSHDDQGRPDGVNCVDGCIKNFSGATQKMDAKAATSSIGTISWECVDIDGALSAVLAQKNAEGKSLRNRKIEVFYGFGPHVITVGDSGEQSLQTLDWLDYEQRFTMLCQGYSVGGGVIKFQADDIQRLELSELFSPDITTLVESITADQMFIPLAIIASTEKFQIIEHDSSYTDRPGETIGYIQIGSEVISHSGVTTDSVYGVGVSVIERGVFNTVAVGHTVDESADDDKKTKVTEFIYLEGPALKLLYAIQTGILYGQDSTLPAHWHHGIDARYIRLDDYLNAGPLLWQPSENSGRKLRFLGLTKVTGTDFISKQILSWLVGIRPIYADGSIGFKPLSSVLSQSDYVAHLNNDSLVKVGELTHNLKNVINDISIKWDWSFIKEDYIQETRVIDSDSVAKYKDGTPLQLEFKGVKSSNQTSQDLRNVFDALRNRFAGGGYTMQVEIMPNANRFEVGDNVRVTTDQMIDPLTNAALDRVFEVEQISPNARYGTAKLNLFASTDAAGEFQELAAGTVLDDSFYQSGIDLNSLTGVSDGVVTQDITLIGGETLGNGIFSIDGDFTIPAGVTVYVEQNVNLRVKGTFTRNGDVIGTGRGLVGGKGGTAFTVNGGTYIESTGIEDIIDFSSSSEGIFYDVRNNTYAIDTDEEPAKMGYMGITQAANFSNVVWYPDSDTVLLGFLVAPPVYWHGSNTSAPRLPLVNRGGDIEGVSALDLRGTSGSGGRPMVAGYGKKSASNLYSEHKLLRDGGDGGNGGAGLLLVCRSEAVGASSVLDLSGDGGAVPDPYNVSYHGVVYSGGGGGGCPGAYYLLIDGNGSFGSSAANITQNRGLAGVADNLTEIGFADLTYKDGGRRWYAPQIEVDTTKDGLGFGREYNPVVDMGEAGFKVQYIPAPEQLGQVADDEPQYQLAAVSGITISGGATTGLVGADNSVRDRMQVTWAATNEGQALRYEVQARNTSDDYTDSDYRTVSIIDDITLPTAFIDVTDGVSYLVRVRVIGDAVATLPSAWAYSEIHTAKYEVLPPGAPSVEQSFEGENLVLTISPGDVYLSISAFWVVVDGATHTVDGGRYSERVTWAGSKTYTIMAVDVAGNVSSKVSSEVDISPSGKPSVVISFEGENIVLSLAVDAGDLPVSHFLVQHGGSIDAVDGGRYSERVTWAGLKTYTIMAVDVAGNVSQRATSVVDIVPPRTPSVSTSYQGENLVLSLVVEAGDLPVSHYLIESNGETVISNSGLYSERVDWVGSKTYIITAVDTAGATGESLTLAAVPAVPSKPEVIQSFEGENLVLSLTVDAGYLPVSHFLVQHGGSIDAVDGGRYSERVTWAGSKTYTITAVDTAGAESAPVVLTMTPIAPGAPVVGQQVIDNFVEFRYRSAPGSLPLAFYEMYRGDTFDSADRLQDKAGTSSFTTKMEALAGTYTYWFVAVDVAGNKSVESAVVATVSQPPDFVFYAGFSEADNGFDGTKNNCLVDNDGALLALIDSGQTWDEYANNGYGTLQDEIDAGHSLFVEPATAAASYSKTYDLGAVVSSSMITISMSPQVLAGNVSTQVDLAFSADGIIWTEQSNTIQTFGTNFQYVRVKVSFASDGGSNDVARVNDIQVSLNLKEQSESGRGAAISSDSEGTFIGFTKKFIDVKSIMVTPYGITARIATYDFADEANPTGFSVFLYDTGGNRVTGDFSWQVTGYLSLNS